VIVHGDDHGNENDRVIEEMQFNPGKEELEHVEGHWLAHEIVMQRGLANQEEVLNMVPELDPERDHPPGVAAACKSLA
jgi:hypothetical protein